MVDRDQYVSIAQEVDARGVWTCRGCNGQGVIAGASCHCCGGLGVHWPGEQCLHPEQ